MIQLADALDGVTAEDLEGFFVGWPHPPSPERHLELLHAADLCVLAHEGQQVVGFATAITDSSFAAYIPLLEVLPAPQDAGLGSAMIRRLLDRLDGYYMVDLVCDPDVAEFYDRLGGTRSIGVGWRNHGALR